MPFEEKLLETLRQSTYWTEKTRDNGTTIQGLICPACDDKNAWAYSNSPLSINCNRKNQCGIRTKTLDLFPELRRNIERDFLPTKEDPHRPAREYLRSRAIPNALLHGLDFRYQPNVRKTGSGAVMFFVGKNNDGKELLNGRIFNPPEGEGKTHNNMSTSGQYWQHPSFTYDFNKPVWIVEGILDALSLLALGEQAIAVLSSGQDPKKLQLGKFIGGFVLAFDNDPAGHHACNKWKEVYKEAEIIICDPEQDFNDFLQSGPLDRVKQLFKSNLPRYRNNGLLVIAKNAKDYAETWERFHEKAPGLFSFNGSTYWSEKKKDRRTGEFFINVSRCLKATVKVVSFIINRTNPARPEYTYQLQIQQRGKRIEAKASGSDIASSRRMKEWFLSYARINFEGDAQACTALASYISEYKKAPEVKQLTVIGYQPETRNYIYGSWAIDTKGRHIRPNKQGLFHLDNQHYLPPDHADDKAIIPTLIEQQQIQEIVELIRGAWGMNGLVAFSWVVAGWFVFKIKGTSDFFPFLSLHGDPASGKSALVTFLNSIQGREGEGLPITQLNSKKGLTRSIGQVSGIFTALLEDSQRNEKGFDYSILLTAYNRGPLQVQAAYSNDLQTKEAPFLGSLLFAQNTEPFNSKQEKQRVISLEFKTEHITDSSREAYLKLVSSRKAEIAGVMLQVLSHRRHFEEGWQDSFKQTVDDLSQRIDERRILENHSLVMAFYRLFCSCFHIEEDESFSNFIAELGVKKCLSSAIRQPTIADHFFEQLDTVEEEKLVCTVHKDPAKKHVYINLPRAENLIRNKGVNLQVNENFCKALTNHPAYVKNGFSIRFPNDPNLDASGRTKKSKVWVFDMEWFLKNYGEENTTT